MFIFCLPARRELLLTDVATAQHTVNQNQAGVDGFMQMPPYDTDDIDPVPSDISTSDMMIMQSSFECKFRCYDLHVRFFNPLDLQAKAIIDREKNKHNFFLHKTYTYKVYPMLGD